MKTFWFTVAAVMAFMGFASLSRGQAFNVPVPASTVSITINGATCTQSGTAFTCNGVVPPPQCPSPPGPGPCTVPPPGECPGFAHTLNIPINWSAPQRMLTANYGNFGQFDIVVASFTTGSGQSQTNNLPRLAAAEYGGGAANREAALSETACSFTPVDSAYYSYQVSSAPTIPFTFNNPYIYPGLYSNLKSNTTYYLNIKNVAGSGCGTNCPMFIDLNKNGIGP